MTECSVHFWNHLPGNKQSYFLLSRFEIDILCAFHSHLWCNFGILWYLPSFMWNIDNVTCPTTNQNSQYSSRPTYSEGLQCRKYWVSSVAVLPTCQVQFMKETLKMTQTKFSMAVPFMPANTERISHVHSVERMNNCWNNTDHHKII